ncbi:type II toxin-antitoxin system PrlF family antitoxin [Lactobacillus acetotolerans]|uniref:type II toxin-antitoxin system PrlF family antitoxin n=1 Tax=Lactobacillus acetotolerans TaxID=1600 RepID=UPI0007BA9631|nr:type II toxin-antitoxin system PrlF family antitoxin [Lactobacillus acetotolerans]QGV04227.1 AbrB family transcriptional regulator [Lactobacillus acetotolerans]
MKTPTKVISKITSKNQVTVPQSIREVLKVGSNDSIQWMIGANGDVTVKNANDNLWGVVKEQEAIYGSVDTPEVDWGPDVESEDL